MNASTLRSAMVSLIVLGAGCGQYVPGNGAAAREVRPVSRFSELEVRDGLRAELTIQGTTSLELAGDSNLLPLVRTEVVGDRLVVRTDEWTHLDPRVPLVVRIGAPALHSIGGSGAAEVTGADVAAPALALSASGGTRLAFGGVRADRVSVDASGASRVEIAGQGQAIDASLSGASALLARGFSGADVRVKGSGASRGEVCANRSLDADLSGASHLDYYCHPGMVTKDLSGASSIDPR